MCGWSGGSHLPRVTHRAGVFATGPPPSRRIRCGSFHQAPLGACPRSRRCSASVSPPPEPRPRRRCWSPAGWKDGCKIQPAGPSPTPRFSPWGPHSTPSPTATAPTPSLPFPRDASRSGRHWWDMGQSRTRWPSPQDTPSAMTLPCRPRGGSRATRWRTRRIRPKAPSGRRRGHGRQIRARLHRTMALAGTVPVAAGARQHRGLRAHRGEPLPRGGDQPAQHLLHRRGRRLLQQRAPLPQPGTLPPRGRGAARGAGQLFPLSLSRAAAARTRSRWRPRSASCPWAPDHRLVRIGLQARRIPTARAAAEQPRLPDRRVGLDG